MIIFSILSSTNELLISSIMSKKLPEELFIEILSFISSKDLIKNNLLVSQSFLNCSKITIIKKYEKWTNTKIDQNDIDKMLNNKIPKHLIFLSQEYGHLLFNNINNDPRINQDTKIKLTRKRKRYEISNKNNLIHYMDEYLPYHPILLDKRIETIINICFGKNRQYVYIYQHVFIMDSNKLTIIDNENKKITGVIGIYSNGVDNYGDDKTFCLLHYSKSFQFKILNNLFNEPHLIYNSIQTCSNCLNPCRIDCTEYSCLERYANDFISLKKLKTS